MAEKFPQLTPYNYAGNKPITGKDLEGLQSTKDTEVKQESGKKESPKDFTIGNPTNPGFSYDNGFLDKYEKRKPTEDDIDSYNWWKFKALGARTIRWDLYNALDAYDHFMGATGADFNFDFDDYFDDDPSAITMLKNAKSIAMESAMELLVTSGNIKMTSRGFSVGGGDARFPYPETEDWQKAVGAFNFWMSADVKAIDENGIIIYGMELTIHAEDKYNFNPGQKDIATGTPDAENGIFEITGLAKQFMQYGTYTVTLFWSAKSKNTVFKD